MTIDNSKHKIPLYVLKNAGVNNDDIYVTGSHLVFNEQSKHFIRVDDYSNAKLQNKITTDKFCCLITSDHKLKIGEEVFWDWEDHFIKASMS
jgi:hypothetical protein